MKAIYPILIIFLSSFINVQSEDTAISFDNSGTGYTISDNVVTITDEGTYDLTNTFENKKIIVSSSCKLNLNSFTLTNNGALTPILISQNTAVELILNGESNLQDSSTNENDGTIYLQSGASLTISGTGTLSIIPNKLMAINGTEGTSLTVDDGATVKIESDSSTVGGIYLRKSITFNNAIYKYVCSNGGKHAIDSEGDIKLIKGSYELNSGQGKGIQSEKNLYIGEENGNENDLTLNILTSNEGIEAMGINIYSGSISIIASEDGINAASSGTECDETVHCSGTCACYINIKGGMLELTSGEDGLDANGDIFISGGKVLVFAASTGDDQPIDQDGLLSINGGAVVAAGSSSMGGVNAQTTQVAKIYSGSVSQGAKLTITDSDNTAILDIQTLKEANYFYFNYESSFTVKINDNVVTLTEPQSQNQQPKGGPEKDQNQNPPGAPGEDNDGNLRKFLELPNILFLFAIIML